MLTRQGAGGLTHARNGVLTNVLNGWGGGGVMDGHVVEDHIFG